MKNQKWQDRLFMSLIVIIVIAFCYTAVFAVSTNTVTSRTVQGQNMKIITVDWHDNDTLDTGTSVRLDMDGFVHQVVTYPHVNGSLHVAPEDAVDLKLYYHDNTSINMMGTQLDNLGTDSVVVMPGSAAPYSAPYVDWATFNHAGNTTLNGGGVVEFYVSPEPR